MIISNMSQARRAITRVYRGHDVDVYRKKGVVHIRVGGQQLPPAEFRELTDTRLLEYVSGHLGAA